MFAGAPDKAQHWVRTIGENEYNHTAGGLSGASNHSSFIKQLADVEIRKNEDCGQMSAWYLFSSMGFYPGLSHVSSQQHPGSLGQ